MTDKLTKAKETESHFIDKSAIPCIKESSYEENMRNNWINERRVNAYPKIFFSIFFLVAIVWVILSKNHIDLEGKPLGCDFIIYWASSFLGLNGHPADAYDVFKLAKVENYAVPGLKKLFPLFYPPSFFVLILPLALLPYLVAYWVFIVSTLAGYVRVLRCIAPGHQAMWCLAGFSGVWMNVFHGQNAFLTASLAAGALLMLPARPLLAGFLIGMLSIKPQLALLFPVALLAIGAWRTIAAAAATAIVLLVFATAVLGHATFTAWVASFSFARHCLEAGIVPWSKMPTTFAFLRLLHISVAMSYAANSLAAACAGLITWHVWRRCGNVPVRNAVLMIATFLVSPYAFDYDLAWLAFPIAWLASEGVRGGWLRGEREVLVAAWVLPIMMDPIVELTSIQCGPLVLAAFLASAVRRAQLPSAARP